MAFCKSPIILNCPFFSSLRFLSLLLVPFLPPFLFPVFLSFHFSFFLHPYLSPSCLAFSRCPLSLSFSHTLASIFQFHSLPISPFLAFTVSLAPISPSLLLFFSSSVPLSLDSPYVYLWVISLFCLFSMSLRLLKISVSRSLPSLFLPFPSSLSFGLNSLFLSLPCVCVCIGMFLPHGGEVRRHSEG